MKKVNMVIDVAKCHDCNNCFLACKDEHWENDFPPTSVAQPRHGHSWLNILNVERGRYPLNDVAYLPLMCQHCDDPACMKVAPDAIYKRDDGIVIIDPVKAKGRKEVVGSCPYNVIYWNEEKNVAQKCTMCVHLLQDGWSQPRCSQCCPTGALAFLYADEGEMEKMVQEQKLEAYRSELGLKPRVYYKNLYRFTKCHVAGSVALADKDDCADGAEITLTNLQTGQSCTAKTNNYGDFKFDTLEPNSGKYRVDVRMAGYTDKSLEFELNTSTNVGTLFLKAGAAVAASN